MTENPSTGGIDPSTLRNVPEGLVDTQPDATGPTPATAFTPPYADVVDTPASAGWDETPAPTLPPTTAAEQASFAPTTAPAARAAGRGGSMLRRWGAPVALVAIGLVGGMAATTALTNADAAPAGAVQQVGQRPAQGGSDDAATTDGPGISVEQLSPDGEHDLDDQDGLDADGDGRSRGQGGPGGYSISDGFSLRGGAPSTQGSTGASR